MLEALALDPAVGGSWFSAADLWCSEEILARADVIVLCHCRYTPEIADLVVRARAIGRRVFFDIDDLVFDTRYVPTVLQYLDHSVGEATLDHWFADFSRYGALLRLCDGAIVTNAFLAARVEDFAPLPVTVLPNFMNQAQLRASGRILAAKRRSEFRRDDHLHLGYFSGSPTHARDFQVVEAALIQLLDADPRLVLRLVGRIDLTGRLRRYERRVETFPLQDPVTLQRLIGEVEINLAPLHDNPFTNCKSELKFFEAAVVGTLTVASPVFAFREAIENGRTGFLAPAHRWAAVLTEVLADFPRHGEMAEAAAAACSARYQPAVQLPAITTALFGDAPAPHGATPRRGNTT
ncbi:MAG: glycosyltransferase [Planctomycetes bacterium]|nr:glycosyltransferase [Planctomycetota bacterium]